MRTRFHVGGIVWTALLPGLMAVAGCGLGGSAWQYFGSPFYLGSAGTGSTGPTSTGVQTSGGFGQADRTPVDPCTEPLTRKFITVSMRNHSQDYIHYFFIAIAFIDVDETAEDAIIPAFDDTLFPDGAVCPDDVALYTSWGYQQIAEGEQQEIGDYCITGPALVYVHENGQFRVAPQAGSLGLGSAIAPAQGTLPTYDTFFDSAGAQMPVPDLILFHNPGTGDGGLLKVSRPEQNPCDLVLATTADPECERDAFYYVTEDDVMSGSRQLGSGSGRRVPNEIQGTGCQCNPLGGPYFRLAPSRLSALNVECDEFLRGGRILFAFLRDDQTPPVPQLVWQVTDQAGSVAHDFDPRVVFPGGG